MLNVVQHLFLNANKKKQKPNNTDTDNLMQIPVLLIAIQIRQMKEQTVLFYWTKNFPIKKR